MTMSLSNTRFSCAAGDSAFQRLSVLLLFLCLLSVNQISAQAPIENLNTDCDYRVRVQSERPRCESTLDGSITVQRQGGGPALTVDFLNLGVAGPTITGIDAGIYRIRVSDGACADTLSFELTYRDPIIAEDINETICADSLVFDPLQGVSGGGSNNYSYDIESLAGQDISCTACPAGPITLRQSSTFLVHISEPSGCTTSRLVDLELIPSLEIEILDIRAAKCAEDGSFDFAVSGGSGLYIFTIDEDNYQFATSFKDLRGNRNYTLTVLDFAGCSATREVFVPSDLKDITNNLEFTTEPVTCFGLADGQITLNYDDQTGPEALGFALINPDSVMTDVQEESTFKKLKAGRYRPLVKTKDQCLRKANFKIEVMTPDSLTLTANATDSACEGDAGGEVTFLTDGGNGGNAFRVAGPVSRQSTDNTIGNLLPGDYLAQVEDSKGCTETTEFTVNAVETFPNELEDIAIVPSCPGDSSGIVIVEAGKLFLGSYSYSLDGMIWQEQFFFENLAPGNYTLFIRSPSGCIEEREFEIPELPEPTLNLRLQHTGCDAAPTGSVVIDITNGSTEDYQYSLDGISFQSTPSFKDLAAGSYLLSLQDSMQCTSEANFEILQSGVLANQIEMVPETCGNDNGVIASLPYGGTPPYRFRWSTGDTTHLLVKLAAGDYGLTVTDDSGCASDTLIKVQNMPGPIVVGNTIDARCFGSASGAIDLSIVGGNEPYFISWSNGRYSEDLDSLPAGNYLVTVVDALSCTSIRSYTVFEPGPIELSSQSEASQGKWSIDLLVQGGVAPYSFKWSNGATTEDLTELQPDTYTVTVTDDQGCSKSLTIDITTTIDEPEVYRQLSLYPNPARDMLTLDWPTLPPGGAYLRIFDARGGLLQQMKLNQRTSSLDLTELPAGMYWLRLETEAGMAIRKFVRIE